MISSDLVTAFNSQITQGSESPSAHRHGSQSWLPSAWELQKAQNNAVKTCFCNLNKWHPVMQKPVFKLTHICPAPPLALTLIRPSRKPIYFSHCSQDVLFLVYLWAYPLIALGDGVIRSRQAFFALLFVENSLAGLRCIPNTHWYCEHRGFIFLFSAKSQTITLANFNTFRIMISIWKDSFVFFCPSTALNGLKMTTSLPLHQTQRKIHFSLGMFLTSIPNQSLLNFLFSLPIYLIILYRVLIFSLVLPNTRYKTEAEGIHRIPDWFGIKGP